MPLGGDSGGITIAVRSREVPVGEGCDVGWSEDAGADFGPSEELVAEPAEGVAGPEHAATVARSRAAPRLPTARRAIDFGWVIMAVSYNCCGSANGPWHSAASVGGDLLDVVIPDGGDLAATAVRVELAVSVPVGTTKAAKPRVFMSSHPEERRTMKARRLRAFPAPRPAQ